MKGWPGKVLVLSQVGNLILHRIWLFHQEAPFSEGKRERERGAPPNKLTNRFSDNHHLLLLLLPSSSGTQSYCCEPIWWQCSLNNWYCFTSQDHQPNIIAAHHRRNKSNIRCNLISSHPILSYPILNSGPCGLVYYVLLAL